MDMFQRIAEEKIREAIERGELDNLAGAGKPLVLEDLSHVPEDLRTAYLMMKNAGYIPEEVQLQKEMIGLRDLLHAAQSDGERRELKRKMTEKQLRYRLLMEERGIHDIPGFDRYADKINGKMEGE